MQRRPLSRFFANSTRFYHSGSTLLFLLVHTCFLSYELCGTASRREVDVAKKKWTHNQILRELLETDSITSSYSFTYYPVFLGRQRSLFRKERKKSIFLFFFKHTMPETIWGVILSSCQQAKVIYYSRIKLTIHSAFFLSSSFYRVTTINMLIIMSLSDACRVCFCSQLLNISVRIF